MSLSKNKKFPKSIEQEIERGENLGISKRFKCIAREPWYSVGNLQVGDGYFFKRSHIFPKLIKNTSGVLATDTAYRIKMIKGFNIESLVFSFYNSFTLIMAELGGRVYGGGVLELTPSEFQSLKIMYHKISKNEFAKLDNLFRKNNEMNIVIDYVDSVILSEVLQLSKNQIASLKKLRKKLVKYRV